jgi:pyruvate/2-oxoglutarate dehydrogenase complex dihydrolipoamide acyltransferase (E2) component
VNVSSNRHPGISKMDRQYFYKKFPRSRIASFDTFAAGLGRHHVAALLEFDVTDARKKLREIRRKGTEISFNGWLIKVISSVLIRHPEAAAFLHNKRKLIIFRDINISVIVEKTIGNSRVPLPLLIERTNQKSSHEITGEIKGAKESELYNNDILPGRKATVLENLYYLLPGFIRRLIWILILKMPKMAFRKMGNVVVTSVGMMGKINGWFIQKSIHPVSFGIGSVIRKPLAVGSEVRIREVLNMTVLIDHDIIDGAPMVRVLDDLTSYIENGMEIS